MSDKSLTRAIRAPFPSQLGINNGSGGQGMYGYDNNQPRRSKNAAGTAMADLIALDNMNRHMFGNYNIRPMRTPLTFTLATNASLVTQRLFVADRNYEITSIVYRHTTANGAAMTCYISKEVTGQAAGSGSSVMTNTFDCNGTAEVIQLATMQSRSNPGYFGPGEPPISVKAGEMLSVKFSTGLTSLAGVEITVYMQPQAIMQPAVFNMQLNADIVTQCFFLANRYLTVTGIQAVIGTVASGAPTITLDVTKDTSTNAPGAGVSLLAAAINVSNTATANTPITPALTVTTTRLLLAPGDRLAIKTTGTLTALAGVTFVVSFANGTFSTIVSQPAGIIQPVYNLFSATNLGVATAFLIADRDYYVQDVSGVWSVAGGTGARVTVTVDNGTTAAGGGTSVLTDNTNAGFDLTATANTVVVGTKSVSARNLLLPAGSRLSAKFAGTTSPVAGLVLAVSLLPA